MTFIFKQILFTISSSSPDAIKLMDTRVEMFLKFKLKRAVKDFLTQAGMNKANQNYILSQNLNQYCDSIKNLKNSPYFSNMSQQNCLERLLVSTAEEYMDELLDIEQGKIKNNVDFIKLHFCLAIMVVITTDQWAPMCNKVLRLDLWHIHWNEINAVGEYIVRQSAANAPFIFILNNLIITNTKSGLLKLEHGYPLEKINKMVNTEYKIS